jgi:hypothetical protein
MVAVLEALNSAASALLMGWFVAMFESLKRWISS